MSSRIVPLASVAACSLLPSTSAIKICPNFWFSMMATMASGEMPCATHSLWILSTGMPTFLASASAALPATCSSSSIPVARVLTYARSTS